ncbi:CBS domain-containing protein [Microcoleus sp. FACHB-672]|uniref:CBS domain-containing protein n=1 Tax=Microcoleus sp. FACHB-672 TaxID=2692825 RepID=UPI0016855B30|nr:CBS domain-containing protein [Microcoleus sp. FACHB-672]MBD2041141.1 CBS domain-containing protein [Microcoleus sp. FACHB-672]
MMQFSNFSIYSPNFNDVIDRSPLIVTPDTSLVDVITLMGKIRESCPVDKPTLIDFNFINKAQDNCVLVMKESQLLGMFTERDVVRLSAGGGNLNNTTIAEVMTSEVITLEKSKFQDIFSALSLMREHQIRHLPVVEDNGAVLGVITSASIRKVLHPFNLLKMRSIQEVMSHEVFTALPSASLLQLAEIMSNHKVSCVVICDSLRSEPHKIPIGIVTERDIVQFQALDLDLTKTQAVTVMSRPLFNLNPDDSLWVAHQAMQQRSVRRLVVTSQQGYLVGLVTQTTLLRVFDPIEMYSVIEVLHQSVEDRTVKLKQANQQLQKEILERHRVEKELKKALDKEKELNELKSRFTSMVSHEFRNPLTVIICYSQLLGKYRTQLTEDKILMYLANLERTARYMNELIDDLLIIGGTEAGKMEFNPAPLDLVELCQALVKEQQMGNKPQPTIIFKCQESFSDVCMDAKLLRHILSNLLGNACKYSPEDSRVYFSLSRQNGKAIFQIRDWGIGIPLEAQERLFESFHRASNVGNIPGTGLGLTIVKKCVDLQGGEMTVESEVGMGTTFTVKLPCHQQKPEMVPTGKFEVEDTVR